MTNYKTTKRTLLFSVLAIVLCIAMLIGTTFAWFTDTASTGVNKIVSGKLSVDIVDENGKSIDGKSLEFKDVNGSSDILWEPGVTFRTNGFKIKNDGNLAIKYKLSLNGVVGDNMLLDVIKFSVVTADGKDAPAVDLDAFEGTLLKGQSTDETLYIQAHMDEAAGNKYQEKELEGIGITVVATQFTYESDSFDNKYDENATYPVVTVDGLKAAFAAGGIVSVNKDITVSDEDTVDASTIISAPTTLNLDKKIISPDNMGENNKNFTAVIVDADTTINATKDGGIDTGKNGAYAINVRKGATLTVNGGTYYGGGTAIQVQKGTLIINGGTFACEPYSNPVYGNKYLINCIDAAWKNGTAKIEIKGGTFINFDPADSESENPHGNFVADGYKVVSEVKGSDTYYTVVPE